MAGASGSEGDRKEQIKDMIKRLHAGGRPDEVKEEFKEVLKNIGPADIAGIEEELINEGMPGEEIRRLCDVHLAVFKESLEREKVLTLPGHPVHTLTEEHRILLQFVDEMKDVTQKVKQAKDLDSAGEAMEHLSPILDHLKDSESHYVREENVLFPYMEKHGVTQPPAVMWSEHNEIRGEEKKLYELVQIRKSMTFKDFAAKLDEAAASLRDMLQSHFYKENNMLFPTALKVIPGNEWAETGKQFDELGYCSFTPERAREVAEKEEISAPEAVSKGEIPLETGSFSRQELETLLNTLPMDITFVDREDRIRYFSQAKERIFPRTRAVIGRTVQQCHPQKSVHVVNKILDEFRNGRGGAAEFWIELNERLIYIRYFALRKDGAYLGTLEVTQDITDIKRIEGEKRLL